MTFLTTRYRLAKALSSQELERLGRLTSVYGIRGVSIEDQVLVVDYDASRAHEAEVLAVISNAGIAVEPEKPISPGAVDHTGEFKDVVWPTTGLTPVNSGQK